MNPNPNTIPNDLDAELSGLWAQFHHLAQRAEFEAKRNSGVPLLETRMALADLAAKLDQTEVAYDRARQMRETGGLRSLEHTGQLTLNGQTYEYERGTAEHARFVKALRLGLAGLGEAAQDHIKMAGPEQMTDQMKAMSLADDTVGGYLASGEFVSEVLRQMADISPVRQVVRILPLSSGPSALIPVRSSIQTAKRISEVATRVQTTADLSLRLENVPVHEMYADTVVANWLLQDSRYPLDGELLDAFTQAARLLEGKEFISGSGNGEMLGLDNATLPTANVIACADSTGHTVTLDDLLKLTFQTVKAVYLPGAKLLLNPKLYGTLRALKGTSSAPSYLLEPEGDNTLFGIPVVFMPDMQDNLTPAAGRNVAYLINPLAYTLAVRQDIIVQRLPELYAEQGRTAFYIWQRVGGQPVIEEAIARLVTA